MRNVALVLFSCLLLSCARQVKTYDKVLDPAQKEFLKIEEPLKDLKIGEKLVYSVDWIGIPAGTITLEVKELVPAGSKLAYHVIARADPNKFFRFFHNAEYTLHSYIDAYSMKSIRLTKERLLKGKLEKDEMTFDYKTGEVTWHYLATNFISKSGITENTQDLLSALYAFRVKDIRPKETYQINLAYSGKAWPMQISFKKEEYIKLGSGNYRVMVAEISSELNNRITGFNNIEIYLSLDKRRTPVIFRIRTKIGYLSGALSSR